MILETYEDKAYRKDGSLIYEATYGVIAPMFQYLYDNRTVRPDGKIVTRLNKAVKYRLDGSIEWCQFYDEYGNYAGKTK